MNYAIYSLAVIDKNSAVVMHRWMILANGFFIVKQLLKCQCNNMRQSEVSSERFTSE